MDTENSNPLSDFVTTPFLFDDATVSNVTDYDAMSNLTNMTSLEGEFEFNHRLLLNVIAYCIMFVVGTIGNTLVFVAAHRQHKSPENNGRTNVHMMILHLTIADLIVCYVVIPLEIGWRLSVQWYAGNFACKLLMFIRGFAFYLSSMTLVCLSLDRFLAISRPLASLQKSGDLTRKRGRIMIVSAWLVSAVFALPQTLVFRVLKHPKIEFLQCTSMTFFTNLLNSSTSDEQFMLTPEVAEKLYSSLFLVVVYMVPLLVIIVTYANILLKIFHQSRSQIEIFDDETPPPPLLRWRTSLRRSVKLSSESAPTSEIPSFDVTPRIAGARSETTKDLLRRNRSTLRNDRSPTKNVALRMSIIHVLTFVTCWTPYLVISLWHIVDDSSVEMVAPEVQDALFLTAVFNSCLNPLVYGGFYFRALTRRNFAKNPPVKSASFRHERPTTKTFNSESKL